MESNIPNPGRHDRPLNPEENLKDVLGWVETDRIGAWGEPTVSSVSPVEIDSHGAYYLDSEDTNTSG